jgi:hypothetical protein
MVRDPVFRSAKYENKIDADVAKARITALKPMMVDQQTVQQANMQQIEEKAKTVLESYGVPSIWIPIYLSFAKALNKKAGNFTQATLDAEAQYVYDKFKARGLNANVLVDVAKTVGVTIATP